MFGPKFGYPRRSRQSQLTVRSPLDPFNGIDTFFDGLFGAQPAWNYSVVTYPARPTDVSDDRFVTLEDGTIEASLVLAGFTREEVNVSFEGQMLTVEAAMKTEQPTTGRATRSYKHSWYVDDSKNDLSQTTASLVNGILTLRIPPHETAAAAVKVEIKVD